MNPNDYLKQILAQQTFDNDDQKLKDLRDRRNAIDKMLRAHFWRSGPSIKWAGSRAKGTMILESYDGDMTCYFLCDEKEAGNTLKEIYEAVKTALQNDYNVECKPSALRVRDKSDWTSDLHIDVVPGRYTDETKSDVFLHRTTGDKQRLRTNLQTHIDHIRDSGVRDAIRLMKLWKVRNGLESAKTFVLELLVVKLLKTEKSLDLSSQLIHVWTKFRDASDSLAVEDPANSNNDFTATLNQCRAILSSAASTTLWLIENKGWKSVFGELKDDDGEKKSRSDSLKVAIEIVPMPTKPWCQKY